MSESAGGDPNSLTQEPNPTVGPDHLAGDMPADPLLKSGTFIDANLNHYAHNNDKVYHAVPIRSEPLQSVSEDFVRSAAETTTTPANAAASQQRRPRRAPEELASERPVWLPEGWGMEFRVRSSGATAGLIDKYYVEPGSGHRFRSKKEVLFFLETGSSRKRKSNSEADVPSENPSGHKEMESAAVSFDFEHPPEAVSWVQTDGLKDTWMPAIGGQMLPESNKREWAAVFSHVARLGKPMAP